VLCLFLQPDYIIDVLQAAARSLHSTVEVLQLHALQRLGEPADSHHFEQVVTHLRAFTRLRALCLSGAPPPNERHRSDRIVQMNAADVAALGVYLHELAPAAQLDEVRCHIFARPSSCRATTRLPRVRSISAIADKRQTTKFLAELVSWCPDLRHLHFTVEVENRQQAAVSQPGTILPLPGHVALHLETLQIVVNSAPSIVPLLCTLAAAAPYHVLRRLAIHIRSDDPDLLRSPSRGVLELLLTQAALDDIDLQATYFSPSHWSITRDKLEGDGHSSRAWLQGPRRRWHHRHHRRSSRRHRRRSCLARIFVDLISSFYADRTNFTVVASSSSLLSPSLLGQLHAVRSELLDLRFDSLCIGDSVHLPGGLRTLTSPSGRAHLLRDERYSHENVRTLCHVDATVNTLAIVGRALEVRLTRALGPEQRTREADEQQQQAEAADASSESTDGREPMRAPRRAARAELILDADESMAAITAVAGLEVPVSQSARTLYVNPDGSLLRPRPSMLTTERQRETSSLTASKVFHIDLASCYAAYGDRAAAGADETMRAVPQRHVGGAPGARMASGGGVGTSTTQSGSLDSDERSRTSGDPPQSDAVKRVRGTAERVANVPVKEREMARNDHTHCICLCISDRVFTNAYIHQLQSISHHLSRASRLARRCPLALV
jgi:hypothetical protein